MDCGYSANPLRNREGWLLSDERVRAEFSASFIHTFDDGAAVFDPVTWQTHVLSLDALELLKDLLTLVETLAAPESASLMELYLPGSSARDGSGNLAICATLACHMKESRGARWLG